MTARVARKKRVDKPISLRKDRKIKYEALAPTKARKNEQLMCELTGVRKHAEEDRANFLKRIVLGISRLSQDEWEKLSDDCREWFNIAVEYVNSNMTPPDIARRQWSYPADKPKSADRLLELTVTQPYATRKELWQTMNAEGYAWEWNSFAQTHNWILRIMRAILKVQKEEMTIAIRKKDLNESWCSKCAEAEDQSET